MHPPPPRLARFVLAIALLLPAALSGQNGTADPRAEGTPAPAAAVKASAPASSSVPAAAAAAATNGDVLVFDPARIAKADIQRALEVARREKKHVLLEVGGNWCPYCKVLDQFFADHPAIHALRQRNFVYVKVNFSEENRNDDVLLDYPLIRGFPHFYVLNAKGELITSQRAAQLGSPEGYSPDLFEAFLRKYGPRR
jgi:thiol:disulfide interchange protein